LEEEADADDEEDEEVVADFEFLNNVDFFGPMLYSTCYK
jgi:hypothetical protein